MEEDYYLKYLEWLAARGVPCYEGDLQTARGMCGVLFEMMPLFFSNSDHSPASSESFEAAKSVIAQISVLPAIEGDRFSDEYLAQSESALRIVITHVKIANYPGAVSHRIVLHIARYCLGCVRGLMFLDRGELQLAWAELAEVQYNEGMIYGLASSTQNDRSSLREQAIKAADARHAENRAIKAQALEYYRAHRGQFPSKDAAAEWIAGNLVPVKFRTVRDWLSGI